MASAIGYRHGGRSFWSPVRPVIIHPTRGRWPADVSSGSSLDVLDGKAESLRQEGWTEVSPDPLGCPPHTRSLQFALVRHGLFRVADLLLHEVKSKSPLTTTPFTSLEFVHLRTSPRLDMTSTVCIEYVYLHLYAVFAKRVKAQSSRNKSASMRLPSRATIPAVERPSGK